jgi:tryptophan synthase beta subunit
LAKEMQREQIVIVNLSGRGDKDVDSVREGR